MKPVLKRKGKGNKKSMTNTPRFKGKISRSLNKSIRKEKIRDKLKKSKKQIKNKLKSVSKMKR